MLLLFILLLLLFSGVGYWGGGPERPWGYYGWSPLGLLLVFVVIWLLFGGGF